MGKKTMSQPVKVVDIYLDDIEELLEGDESSSTQFMERFKSATELAQRILDEIDGHDLATINMAILLCKKIISQALDEKSCSTSDVTPVTLH